MLPARIPLLIIAVLAALAATAARAQSEFVPEFDSAAPSVSNVPVAFGLPGHVWFSANGADEGFGYDGSYFTVGALMPTATDQLGGHWFTEVRNHISKDAGYFVNVGLIRRAVMGGTIFGVSGWYTYDGDEYENFGHSFHELGVGFEMRQNFFEVVINGYIPIGDTDFGLGAENCFVGNHILTTPGIDSALRGFDGTVGVPVPGLGQWGGQLNVGGYLYRSDLIGTFGGFTSSLEVYPTDRFSCRLELNTDEEFDTTGLFTVTYHAWGGFGRQRGCNQLIQSWKRRDHIARVHQDPEYAINPDTGQRYEVVHVNNANSGTGSGTAEDPFNALVLAQNNSNPNDIIFVNVGDGTDNNMNMGITLQNNQRLLGDGVRHVLPLAGGGGFVLCNNVNGLKPSISGPAFAVQLANNNEVAGFNITGGGNGVQGNGTNNSLLRELMMNNVTNNGVNVIGGGGFLTLQDSMIVGSGNVGFNVAMNTGPITVSNSSITGSTSHGVNLTDNTTGPTLITGSTISGNGIGAGNGVNVSQTMGTNTVTVTGSNIDRNTTGVAATATGAGTTLTVNVTDNPSIGANANDGTRFSAAGDATLNVNVLRNPSIRDNGAGGGGVGINLSADGAAGGMTTNLVAVIDSNGIFDNTGQGPIDPIFAGGPSGIGGSFLNDSNAQVTITNNMFDNTGLANLGTDAAIQLHYNQSNMIVNNLVVNGNIATNQQNGFLSVLTDGMTVLDTVAMQNMASFNGQTVAYVAQGNSLQRATMTGNMINQNTLAALFLISQENGQLIFNATNNAFNNNVTAMGQATFIAQSFDTSMLTMRVTGNSFVSATADEAYNGLQGDMATVFAQFTNNNFGNNMAGMAPRDFMHEIDNTGVGSDANFVFDGNTAFDYELINDGDAASDFNFEVSASNVGTIVQTLTGAGTMTQLPFGTIVIPPDPAPLP